MRAAQASTLKGKRLTVQNVDRTARNIAQFIQDEKIRLSRHRIRQFQGRGRWPEEYQSWVGKIADRNLFEDPERFFAVMASRPDLYTRRFTFRRGFDQAIKDLLDAAAMAYATLRSQAYKYGVKTGQYKDSFVMLTRRGASRRLLTNLSQLEDATADTVLEIYNPLEYASTVERNAVHHARIGGVFYFTGQKVKRRFPGLAVNFRYTTGDEFGGVSHYYQVPVLSIGTRGNVTDQLQRPTRRRRRSRRRRRLGY